MIDNVGYDEPSQMPEEIPHEGVGNSEAFFHWMIRTNPGDQGPFPSELSLDNDPENPLNYPSAGSGLRGSVSLSPMPPGWQPSLAENAVFFCKGYCPTQPWSRDVVGEGLEDVADILLLDEIGRMWGPGLAAAPRVAADTSEALAVKGLTSVPVLTQASGGKMLGEALNVLKATPAAQRGELAAELMSQIEARATGGAWSASEMRAADGARVFSGEYHALVVDSAGNVFKGPNGGLALGLVNGEPGVVGWPGLTRAF